MMRLSTSFKPVSFKSPSSTNPSGMQVIDKVDELRYALKLWQRENLVVGLVPTMGSLHAGHLKLIEVAKETCDKVVVTIFVNPSQFAPHEDFDKYPRGLESDCCKLQPLQPNILFTPTTDLIYPQGSLSCTKILPPESMTKILCGKSRPHFFDGVAQVCNILFNLVYPAYAFFGEKDRQQLVVVRRMVQDLHLPIQIIGVPTVRDENGLALSSRNEYLTESKKVLASELPKLMLRVKSEVVSGCKSYDKLCANAFNELKEKGFRVDYFEIRNSYDLSLDVSQSRCIFAAAWLDDTRLIDNILIDDSTNGDA